MRYVWKLKNIILNKLSICLKRKEFNWCILPEIVYGSGNMDAYNNKNTETAEKQGSMERALLVIRMDRKRTKVTDVMWLKTYKIIDGQALGLKNRQQMEEKV